MANKGVVLGHVSYGGAPVAGASVVLRSISAAASSELHYWNPRWPDPAGKTTYPRSVPLEYTNENGNFIILFHWEPADVGIALDRIRGNLIVQAVHPTLSLSVRGRGTLETGVDWVRLFQSMTIGAGLARHMQTRWTLPARKPGGRGTSLRGAEIKLPELFTGTASITYTPAMVWAVGAVWVNLG